MTGTTHVNTKTLPPNVFDLQHDAFYTFVERHVGVLQAKILQFQLISDATTFIECHDPTEILQYNSEKLIDLKQKACLITNNGAWIVLPGVVASFKMLKKCLLKKNEEDNKRNRNKMVNSSAPAVASVTDHAKSIDDQKNHITTAISRWLRTHRDEMNFKQDALLEENKDYHIEFKNVNNSNESAAIICGCGRKATISRVNNTGYYQISNYYRHIERGYCSVMQKKLNVDREQEDDGSNGDNSTNSNTSSVTPESSLNDANQKKIFSKRRRLSTSTTPTRRRAKHRRL